MLVNDANFRGGSGFLWWVYLLLNKKVSPTRFVGLQEFLCNININMDINIHISLASDIQPDTISSRLNLRTGDKGVFGSEGAVRWRELHIEGLHVLHFSTNISRVAKSRF